MPPYSFMEAGGNFLSAILTFVAFSANTVYNFTDVFVSAITAYKPNLFVWVGRDLFGGYCISCWMPFECNVWILLCYGFTYGTTFVTSHTLGRGSGKGMTFGTTPVVLGVAHKANRFKGDAVCLFVPFVNQFWPVCNKGIVIAFAFRTNGGCG